MPVFGLIIMTGKSYRAGRKQDEQALESANAIIRAVKADRDAANKQIERLLHNHLELTLLWAACRDCAVDKQVRVVFNRLVPKTKG